MARKRVCFAFAAELLPFIHACGLCILGALQSWPDKSPRRGIAEIHDTGPGLFNRRQWQNGDCSFSAAMSWGFLVAWHNKHVSRRGTAEGGTRVRGCSFRGSEGRQSQAKSERREQRQRPMAKRGSTHAMERIGMLVRRLAMCVRHAASQKAERGPRPVPKRRETCTAYGRVGRSRQAGCSRDAVFVIPGIRSPFWRRLQHRGLLGWRSGSGSGSGAGRGAG